MPNLADDEAFLPFPSSASMKWTSYIILQNYVDEDAAFRHALIMKRAFGYLRVSGKGQVEGDGFPRQLEAVKKYAAANDIKIVKVYREEGVSGTTEWENRPAFAEMMAAMLSDGTRAVLVERLDRVARDLMVQESIISDFKRKGLEVISVNEPDLCSDDPSRVLMRQMMGAFFQYEKSSLVAKLRGARVRMRKSTGSCEGRKPYGSRDGEAKVISRILALRKAGAAMDTIADTLNVERLAARSGGQWYGSTVRNILLREAAVA
jgi:DNA invertase Pin-like site-specific DNA recombinase